MYLSVTSLSKNRHRTFWGFQHREEIIRKHDEIACWLCNFCEAVNVTEIFSATSTVWIGSHLRKRHQQQKPLSQDRAASSSSISTRGSILSPVTPEQLALFKLKLITWMVKKHISYSQVEDDDSRKFVASCSLGAANAETLLTRSGNAIRS